MLVSNNFSTQTSYENQTKKAINNKFVQEAMTEFLRAQLEVYFIENPLDAGKIAEQVLINKRSRETAERARITVKKKLSGNLDIANRVQKFVDCRSRDASRRELYIVEGDSAMGSVKLSRDAEFQGIMPIPRQNPQLSEGGLCPHFQERDHHGPAARYGLRRRRCATSTSRT